MDSHRRAPGTNSRSKPGPCSPEKWPIMHIFKVGEKPECLRKPTHTQGEDAKCPAPLRIGTHDFHAVLHTHLRFLHYKSILLQPCFITLTLTHPLNLNGKPCDSCGPTLQVQLLENTLENCVLANRSSANVGMQTCWTKLVYFCQLLLSSSRIVFSFTLFVLLFPMLVSCVWKCFCPVVTCIQVRT